MKTNIGLDRKRLFATRYIRLFGFGIIAIIIPSYLSNLGYSGSDIGLITTLTLIGDLLISLLITSLADRIGRRLMLIIGGILIFFAAIVFIITDNFILLVFASIFGIMSPSGNEVGPFLPIEQSALSQIVSSDDRTKIFAWYNLAGSFATAFGALIAGWASVFLQNIAGLSVVEAHKIIIGVYALTGVIQIYFFARMSRQIESEKRLNPDKVNQPIPKSLPHILGIPKSSKIVTKLSILFSLDALGGGFIITSILTTWFLSVYHLDAGILGSVFFGANILAGISALVAIPLAKKIGLIKTMVFTHIPSNILLILVPLMPNLLLAVILLFLRFSISQMDVPTRQAYVMQVVPPEERSAAGGVTGMARSLGAAISPGLAGILLTQPSLINLPFYLCGGIKILYDLLLYRNFKKSEND